MLETGLKVLLIVGGCLLVPILGGIIEAHLKRTSNLGITSMFFGSIVSLVGFGLCVSWYFLSSTWGLFAAFMVFSMAWVFFLFMSFSVYTTQIRVK